jgi:hypothetical protein
MIKLHLAGCNKPNQKEDPLSWIIYEPKQMDN